jgi:hypothetical protein
MADEPAPKASGGVPANAAAADGAADVEESAGKSYRGYYVLGLVVQVLVWALIFLGIVVAIAVGGQLTEFRYVGF